MAKKVGRKSKYESHVKPMLKDITAWLREGETQASVCKRIGVSQSAFIEYKKEFPKLNEAIKKGEQFLDLQVEESLAKRAIGYEYEETKTVIEVLPSGDKKKRIEKVKKHIAPDVGAIALYMKHKRILQSKDEELTGVQIKKAQAEASILQNRADKLTVSEMERQQVNDLIAIGQEIIGLGGDEDATT
ncbi:hypothetical protein HB834_00385 [Listeria booriae]|uniref:hypothetical protein n=1 Tax=Listeria booriae TaxID=1552123 RepID=UPI00164DF569|nr:hypothetical protein [Listeria booriae]MBC6150104.1 hypothetical protein [Listeria booriae]